MELVNKIKQDPKAFYAYVRSKTKVKTEIGPILDDMGILKVDEISQSEILNNYFSTVFTKENLDLLPTISNRINNCLPERAVETL